MKILVVSRWLWEERARNGGQPGFFGELFQAIAARNPGLVVLSQARDAGFEPEPRSYDGLELHVFSRERRRAGSALLDKILKPWCGYRKAATDAAIIRQFVRAHGPFDAVVAQCEEPDGIACALAARNGDFPPLLTQVHDLRYRFSPGGVRFVRHSSLGYVFRQSARVIANSQQTAEWLRGHYGVPENKIGQCRIHLSAPFLRQPAGQAVELDPERPRILFLGALNRKKAPDVFLRAAIELAPQIPGATFVLIGGETTEDRAFRAALEVLLAQPALAGRVEALGRLDAAAVIEQIRRATVVVCPSRIETFSRTTIEALALGRPVIVTATTGAAQWVRSTGCGAVVPPDDPTALAGAIKEWSSRRDAPNASAQVVSELTAAHAADDWLREVHAAVGLST